MLFFFFNDTATTEIYTLSLHDALPICAAARALPSSRNRSSHARGPSPGGSGCREATLRETPVAAESGRQRTAPRARSEEHTSELQSQSNLVCRLLLEKKKKTSIIPIQV